MKVLVAGIDDTTVAFLHREGITTLAGEIEDADDLIGWIDTGECNAAVLQLEKTGLGVYAPRGVRAKGFVIPIVGISKGSEDLGWSDYRALFLESGGDDLLRAPGNPRELTATLRAVARRFAHSLHDVVELTYRNAKLKLNFTTKMVYVNGLEVDLTTRERMILLVLAGHLGKTVTRDAIMAQLYTAGVDDEPEIKIIDVYITKTRTKLRQLHPDTAEFIQTVWGQGYRVPLQSELASKEAAVA